MMDTRIADALPATHFVLRDGGLRDLLDGGRPWTASSPAHVAALLLLSRDALEAWMLGVHGAGHAGSRLARAVARYAEAGPIDLAGASLEVAGCLVQTLALAGPAGMEGWDAGMALLLVEAVPRVLREEGSLAWMPLHVRLHDDVTERMASPVGIASRLGLDLVGEPGDLCLLDGDLRISWPLRRMTAEAASEIRVLQEVRRAAVEAGTRSVTVSLGGGPTMRLVLGDAPDTGVWRPVRARGADA